MGVDTELLDAVDPNMQQHATELQPSDWTKLRAGESPTRPARCTNNETSAHVPEAKRTSDHVGIIKRIWTTVPSHREMLDLVEIQEPWLPLPQDGSVMTLFRRQNHCPCHRRMQPHRAVIFQDDELFGV